MKRVLVASCVLAFALVTPVVAQQNANTVTIAAKPAKITFGKSAVVSGQVTGTGNAGVPGELEEQAAPFTAGFKKTATVTSDASGNYSFTVTPTATMRYRTSVKIKGKTTSP